MPIVGRRTWPTGELLRDDDLLDRVRGTAPRLGQVRHHPAALGDRGGALLTRNRFERSDFRADFVAHLLGLGVEVDVELAQPGRRRDVDDPLRIVGGAAEARGQQHRAAVVDVGVVLPGEADAAVHLDAVLRAVQHRLGRQRGGDGCGEFESRFCICVLAVLVDRAGGVPHRRGRPLGVGDHLGALVLDGLELADRPAELLADLRVGGRGVGGPARDADALGGQQGGHQRAGVTAAEVGQHAVVADLDGVGADMGQGPQRVNALDGFDLQLVGVEHHPLLAAVDRHRKHQHRRLRGGRDGPHLAADDQAVTVPGGGQPGVDGVCGDDAARGEVVEQLGLGVVRGDQRAGDRRRHEGAGYRAVAELGDDDRQFEDAEALTADRLRQVHALQPLLCRGLPVGRRVGDRGLQGFVQHIRRRHPRHQGPDRIG